MTPDLSHFLPYLLNRAAELASRDFQPSYKERYGMLRTEWRVLFHLGHRGGLTATEICTLAQLHKTKVSRAVTALEKKRFLKRETVTSDRRSETLTLTRSGQAAFADLAKTAVDYDRALEDTIGSRDFNELKGILAKLIARQS